LTPETGYFLEKARRLLGDAEAMLGMKLHDAAGRTAYLAGFHAAQAFISDVSARVSIITKARHNRLWPNFHGPQRPHQHAAAADSASRARLDVASARCAAAAAMCTRQSGAGGGCGNVAPAVLLNQPARANQPARVTRPLCGSIVKRAITEPSGVARANPIAPSGAGATSTTFQL
jgi:hypothetical protein